MAKPGVDMRKWLERIEKSMLAHAREVAINPGEHKRSVRIVFSLAKRYARLSGVHPILVQRADKIFGSTRSMFIAMRFLKNMINLAQGRRVGDFYDDFVSRLETDEERKLVRDLLVLQLDESNNNSDDYMDIKSHIFRLDEPVLDIGEVREFVDTHLREMIKNAQSKKDKVDDNTQKLMLDQIVTVRNAFIYRGKKIFVHMDTLLSVALRANFMSKNVYLGVFSHEMGANELIRIFESLDFRVTESGSGKTVFSKNDIIFHVYMCKVEADHVVMEDNDNIHRWYNTYFDICRTDYMNTYVYAPNNYEKILEEHYGNWRSDQLFRDSDYDNPSLVFYNNSKSILYLLNYLANAISKGWRYWAHEPARLLSEQFGIDYTGHFPHATIKSPVPESCYHRTFRRILVLSDFAFLQPYLVRVGESAASLVGDKVMVGVLSDRLLAGMDGEVVGADEKKRMELARSLHFVDQVFLLDDPEADLNEILHLKDRKIEAIAIERKYRHVLPKELMQHESPGLVEVAGSEDETSSISRDEGLNEKTNGAPGLQIVTFDERTECLTRNERNDVMARHRASRKGRHNGLEANLEKKGTATYAE